MAEYELALPPLTEQSRIGKLLKLSQVSLDGNFDLNQSLRVVLKSLAKKFFIDSTEGSLTRVNSVAKIQNGTTPKRSRPEYWNGDVPWLPTSKVNDRRITEAEEFISTQALDDCSLNIVPAGSTLIAMIGQGKTRGKAAFLAIDATINQNFAALTPIKNIDPQYLFYQLEAKYEALRHWSQGTNQHALNCRLVSSFPFRILPLPQQLEIIEQIEEVELATKAAIERLSVAINQRGRLIRSILG